MIICCDHAEKRGTFSLYFCCVRSEFRICCKSVQNAPECFKCVMIGLSCKWSLTFHYMSCLSSLMATAPRSCYIRAIYSCLTWLAHSGTRLEGKVKVRGKGPQGAGDRSLSPHQQSAPFVRGEEALNFSLAILPECISCLGEWLPSCLLVSIGDLSQRMPSWHHQHLWAVSPLYSYGLKSRVNRLTHWRDDCGTLCRQAMCCIHLN